MHCSGQCSVACFTVTSNSSLIFRGELLVEDSLLLYMIHSFAVCILGSLLPDCWMCCLFCLGSNLSCAPVCYNSSTHPWTQHSPETLCLQSIAFVVIQAIFLNFSGWDKQHFSNLTWIACYSWFYVYLVTYVLSGLVENVGLVDDPALIWPPRHWMHPWTLHTELLDLLHWYNLSTKRHNLHNLCLFHCCHQCVAWCHV